MSLFNGPLTSSPSTPDDEDYGEEMEAKMTVEEFLRACKNNEFTDYDGFGEFLTESGTNAKRVYPSDTVKEGFEAPDWATHVVWYNK